MSAKKSWDIAPSAPRKKSSTPAPRPVRRGGAQDIVPRASTAASTRRAQAVRPPRVPQTKDVTFARGARKREEPRESIKDKRKRMRKAGAVVIGVLSVVVLVGAGVLVWQPSMRIDTVQARGLHTESVEQLTRQQLWGAHAWLLPRNSLFLIPQEDIRAAVFAAHPDIESLSISTNGLQTLVLTTSARTEAFVWCGETYTAHPKECYSANAEGLVFAPRTLDGTVPLRVFGALVEGAGTTPAGSHLAQASQVAIALRFVKAIQTLGPGVTDFVFRGDESDLLTRVGSRITYVTGREQEALEIAESSLKNISLNDGTIEYVDLRFPGRAYFRRGTPHVDDALQQDEESDEEIKVSNEEVAE